MDTKDSMPSKETRRLKRPRPTRAERFARQWAPAIHAELLEAWGARDDGPMPTAEDAEKLATERTRLLVDALGDWAEVSPKVMDLNQKAARPGRRGWRRNAWSRLRRFDSGPRWWFFFGDEE
jgi:hypothetical protein